MISIEGLDDFKPDKNNADQKFGDENRSSVLSTGRDSGAYTSRSSSN